MYILGFPRQSRILKAGPGQLAKIKMNILESQGCRVQTGREAVWHGAPGASTSPSDCAYALAHQLLLLPSVVPLTWGGGAQCP